MLKPVGGALLWLLRAIYAAPALGLFERVSARQTEGAAGPSEEAGLLSQAAELTLQRPSPFRRAGRAVAAGEVAALAHELRDHAVEGGALEVQGLAAAAHALLARAQSAEVLRHRGARRSVWDSSLALTLSGSWQQSAHGSACTGRGWGGRDTECVIKRESWEGAQIRAAHLRGLGHDVRTKRHLDAAGRRAADGHVEVDDRSAHGC